MASRKCFLTTPCLVRRNAGTLYPWAVPFQHAKCTCSAGFPATESRDEEALLRGLCTHSVLLTQIPGQQFGRSGSPASGILPLYCLVMQTPRSSVPHTGPIPVLLVAHCLATGLVLFGCTSTSLQKQGSFLRPGGSTVLV